MLWRPGAWIGPARDGRRPRRRTCRRSRTSCCRGRARRRGCSSRRTRTRRASRRGPRRRPRRPMATRSDSPPRSALAVAVASADALGAVDGGAAVAAAGDSGVDPHAARTIATRVTTEDRRTAGAGACRSARFMVHSLQRHHAGSARRAVAAHPTPRSGERKGHSGRSGASRRRVIARPRTARSPAHSSARRSSTGASAERDVVWARITAPMIRPPPAIWIGRQPLAEEQGRHDDRVGRLDRADERGRSRADPARATVERLDRDERREEADPDDAGPRRGGDRGRGDRVGRSRGPAARNRPPVAVIIRALATAAPAPPSPSSPARSRRSPPRRAERTIQPE